MKSDSRFMQLINKRRQFIAAFSHSNVGPTGHCNVEADLTAAIAYRKEFNLRHPDVKLTFNDMIIKAAANALHKHPLYLCNYDGRYSLFPTRLVDIRFPVDIGNHLGWGMVRDADKKSLKRVAIDSKTSIERTRRDTPRKAERWDDIFTNHPVVPSIFFGLVKTLTTAGAIVPSIDRWRRDLTRKFRGTFLITNVGPAGIMRMEGPIVAPDILHLMITATRPTPTLEDGKIVIKPMLPLVAKYDCRMTDTVHAAAFLSDVKKNLEAPGTRLGPY